MKYLATFYSHYQALTYKKNVESEKVKGKLKSVPRSLSSSCGTCYEYEAERPYFLGCEALYIEEKGDWRIVNE